MSKSKTFTLKFLGNLFLVKEINYFSKDLIIIPKKILKKATQRNFIRRRFKEILRLQRKSNKFYKIIALEINSRTNFYKNLRSEWSNKI